MTEIGNDAQLGTERMARIERGLAEQEADWQAEQERVQAQPETDEESAPPA